MRRAFAARRLPSRISTVMASRTRVIRTRSIRRNDTTATMRFAAILLAALALLACKDKAKSKPAVQQHAGGDKPSLRGALETADVEGAGTVPAVGLGPKVVINKQEILVDG